MFISLTKTVSSSPLWTWTLHEIHHVICGSSGVNLSLNKRISDIVVLFKKSLILIIKFLSCCMEWNCFVSKNKDIFLSWKEVKLKHEKLFSFLDKHILKKHRTYYIAVSTWLDSMYLFYSIVLRAKKNKIPTSSLFVLHYNHHQRSHSFKEQDCLIELCRTIWVRCISATYRWKNAKEKDLRESRYLFFSQVIEKNIRNTHSPYLFLWHHLDDRIETTRLHTIRWCSIRGHLNMSFLKKKWWFCYVRPLLETTKNDIRKYSQDLWLVSFEDTTNVLSHISKRNFFRNNVFLCEEYSKKYKEEYTALREVRKIQNRFKIYFCELRLFHYDLKRSVVFSSVVTLWDVERVLDALWIYTNISYRFLKELFLFFQQASWTKQCRGRTFFNCHWSTYWFQWLRSQLSSQNTFLRRLAKEKSPFWKILKEELFLFWTWATICYPENSYLVKWKKLNKWYINQKIPVFLRTHLPVIKDSSWNIFPISRKKIYDNWYI